MARTGRRAVVAWVDQVEHRSYPGRGGCGRCDQDGAGDASRAAAGDVARGLPCPHVDWCGGSSLLTEAQPWPADGSAASGRGLLVRDQWHQRTRDHRRSAPPVEPVPAVRPVAPVVPLLLSAKTRDGVGGQAGRLARLYMQRPGARRRPMWGSRWRAGRRSSIGRWWSRRSGAVADRVGGVGRWRAGRPR